MNGNRTRENQSETPAAKAEAAHKPRKIKFQIAADPESRIYLAGSFNDWDPAGVPMKRNGNGTFVATLPLPPGRHEYKFVVNGVWQPDPACPQWVPNGHGSLNSVVDVS